MPYVASMSFSILINGVVFPFFQLARGIWKNFPLSPYLFLLVIEGLSRLLEEENRAHWFHFLVVRRNGRFSHLLFVDDILIFLLDEGIYSKFLKYILNLLFYVMCMIINITKLTIYFLALEVD